MTTKTFRLSSHDIDRRWHVLDADGRPLGRVASDAAKLLLGKHKPTYEPHLAMGDFVVVVNASRVRLTGEKAQKKVYMRHTGYPGGLRERSFQEQIERDPRRVIEGAVKGMLPHNSRGRELFRHLKVYGGAEHPHEAQVMAGTGERARKRAAQAVVETRPVRPVQAAAAAATAEAPVMAPAGAQARAPEAARSEARPPASLSRWKREELDAEAQRLGITVAPDWKKADVIAAIEEHRAAE